MIVTFRHNRSFVHVVVRPIEIHRRDFSERAFFTKISPFVARSLVTFFWIVTRLFQLFFFLKIFFFPQQKINNSWRMEQIISWRISLWSILISWLEFHFPLISKRIFRSLRNHHHNSNFEISDRVFCYCGGQGVKANSMIWWNFNLSQKINFQPLGLITRKSKGLSHTKNIIPPPEQNTWINMQLRWRHFNWKFVKKCSFVFQLWASRRRHHHHSCCCRRRHRRRCHSSA